jgi:3-deoxy-7-phosphoheptulonate synthase
MIIVMKKNATDAQIHRVIQWIESVGYKPHPSRGVERTIIGAVGDDRGKSCLKYAESLSGVEKTMPILKPYKLASRESRLTRTIIPVGDVAIGGPDFVVMAGPCSVESEEQMMEAAYIVKKGGAHIVRGGGVQAAHIAVQLPGHGRGRPENSRTRPPEDGNAGRDGGCQSSRRGSR